MHIAHRNVGAN